MSQVATVKENSNAWQLSVPSSQKAQKSFTDVSFITYYIQENSLIGTINVTSNQIQTLAHNQQDDAPLTLNINSQFQPSSLSVERLIESFTMDYNQTEEGVLKLLGNGMLYQIHLKSQPEWLSFKQNDFDFTASKIVTYGLIPQITNTSQTNQTYIINITITSANAPEINLTLPVFINYANTVSEYRNYSTPNYCLVTEGLIRSYCFRDSVDKCQTFFNDWCLEYPERCPTKLIEVNETTELTTLMAEVKEKSDRNYNQQNQYEQTYLQPMNTNVQDLQIALTDAQKKITEFESRYQKDRSSSFWTKFFIIAFLITIILIIAGVFGFKYMKSHQHQREGAI